MRWLVHELRDLGFDVVCLDARHARAPLKMQIKKTDQNDAEGLAHIRSFVRAGIGRFTSGRSIAAAPAQFSAP
jgi:transposase